MVEKQMPDDGGWIEWKWQAGYVLPDGDVLVEVKTRDGDQYEGHVDGFMRGRWEHSPYISAADHIIAYRIVSQSLPNTHADGGR